MKKELGTFFLLVILCIVVAVLNPRFLAGANLQNMARLIGAYGIFSIGLGLVIITGGIDLSVGSVFALLGVLLSLMLTSWGWPSPHRRSGSRRRGWAVSRVPLASATSAQWSTRLPGAGIMAERYAHNSTARA